MGHGGGRRSHAERARGPRPPKRMPGPPPSQAGLGGAAYGEEFPFSQCPPGWGGHPANLWPFPETSAQAPLAQGALFSGSPLPIGLVLFTAPCLAPLTSQSHRTTLRNQSLPAGTVGDHESPRGHANSMRTRDLPGLSLLDPQSLWQLALNQHFMSSTALFVC